MRPKDRSSAFIDSDTLGRLSKEIQRLIEDDPSLNDQISIVIKHALDYGCGFLSAVDGVYEAILPLFVNFGFLPGGSKFFIAQVGEGYWIFGEKGELSKKLKITVVKKYFGVLVKPGESEEKYDRFEESDVPLFMMLEFDYYKNEAYVPRGCGITALSTAIKVNEMLCHAKNAQTTETNPPAFAPGGLDDIQASSLRPGAFTQVNYSDAPENTPLDVRTPFRISGSNTLAYVEFWRSGIRKIYLLDQIVASAPGQQTAVDSARNAEAASRVYAAAARPFLNDFMQKVMRNFVEFHAKGKVSRDLRGALNMKDLTFHFLGRYTGETISVDLQYYRVLSEAMSQARAFDPNVLLMVNMEALVRKTLEDALPPGFYYSPREYENRLAEAAERIATAQASMNGGENETNN